MKLNKLIFSFKTQISVFGVMLALLTLFAVLNPRVFLDFNIYRSLFTVYPIPLILACALVFVVVSGENDLSFPSTMGITLWIFSLTCIKTGYPAIGLLLAVITGLFIGFINGILVTKLKLSSLVVTLGMNFLLRGIIQIGAGGQGIPLVFLNKSFFHDFFVGKIASFPVQMIWGFLFMGICIWIFNRHKFGAHIRYVGDNVVSASETGIKVARVKIVAYMLTGLAAALAGVFSGLINSAFWPTSGDSYLLTTLAAVFLGGTPTWGGIGTIVGAAIGAFILSFLETGIISIGLSGFYTRFFFGLIIVLALVSHKFSSMKRRGG